MADRPSSTAPGTVYEALPAPPQTARRPYSEHRPGRARPTLNDRSDAGLASAVVAALLPCPVWALETRERRADDEADAAPDSACAIASPGCAVSTKPRRRRPQRSAGSGRVDGEAPGRPFRPVVSSPSPSEPDVRLPPHPALHEHIGWFRFMRAPAGRGRSSAAPVDPHVERAGRRGQRATRCSTGWGCALPGSGSA